MQFEGEPKTFEVKSGHIESWREQHEAWRHNGVSTISHWWYVLKHLILQLVSCICNRVLVNINVELFSTTWTLERRSEVHQCLFGMWSKKTLWIWSYFLAHPFSQFVSCLCIWTTSTNICKINVQLSSPTWTLGRPCVWSNIGGIMDK